MHVRLRKNALGQVVASRRQPEHSTGIELQVGSYPTVDIALKVGSVSEQVQVEANANLVETRSVGVGQVIDNQRAVPAVRANHEQPVCVRGRRRTGQAHFAHGYIHIGFYEDGTPGEIRPQPTSAPSLVLINPSFNVMGGSAIELLNPNGWYCMRTTVNILGRMSIRAHCKARLAAASDGKVALADNTENRAIKNLNVTA